MTSIRRAEVAGTFYPADAHKLNSEIEKMLSEASVKTEAERLVGLIVPHAGYTYSGFTAAHAYKLLRNASIDTVVIISPSHREYFDGISIFNGTAYQTPLGKLPLDEELREKMVDGESFIISSKLGHGLEHAIEVQIPFLQKVMGNFKILPIVMGDQRRDYCYHLGEKLSKCIKGKRVILIASSDLSHYHPYDKANQLDSKVINTIQSFDEEKLMNDLEAETAEACGGGPIVSAMVSAKKLGANRVEILFHCNSGDITGDRSAVVGYLSAAILRSN